MIGREGCWRVLRPKEIIQGDDGPGVTCIYLVPVLLCSYGVL